MELIWAGKYGEDERLRRPESAQYQMQDRELYEAGLNYGRQMTLFTEQDDRWCNQLIHGDNLLALTGLLSEYKGKVNLIYIDPPFATGSTFAHRVQVQGRTGPVTCSEVAYSDRWGRGLDGYVQMLYERLTLMSELLAPAGSIYLHVDPTVSHYAKAIMDEVFGADAFQREIIWRIGWTSGFKSRVRNWVRNHDTILFYARPGFTFNKPYLPYPPGYERRGGGRGRGYPVDDVWNANPAELALSGVDSLDSIQIKSFSGEKTGFATQKPESLIRRIIAASSQPGDVVADFFCGSGTTAVAAESLQRRWIVCDQSPIAVHVTRKRLLRLDQRHKFKIRSVTRDSGSMDWSKLLAEYGATAVADLWPVVGEKSGLGVMIMAGDCGPEQIAQAAVVCKTQGWEQLHVLAEVWQEDAVTMCDNHGLDVVPVRIEQHQGCDVRFRQVAQVNADLIRSGQEIAVQLTGFSGPCDTGCWDMVVDYWAVDWNQDDDGVFRPDWAVYRSKEIKDFPLISPWHKYGDDGGLLVVIVADVFGNQARRSFQVR